MERSDMGAALVKAHLRKRHEWTPVKIAHLPVFIFVARPAPSEGPPAGQAGTPGRAVAASSPSRLPKAEHGAAEWQAAMEGLDPGRDAEAALEPLQVRS